MICYRDRSYCSDMDSCQQAKGKCIFVLAPHEAKRAEILKLPICWMTFKDTCTDFKTIDNLEEQNGRS